MRVFQLTPLACTFALPHSGDMQAYTLVPRSTICHDNSPFGPSCGLAGVGGAQVAFDTP